MRLKEDLKNTFLSQTLFSVVSFEIKYMTTGTSVTGISESFTFFIVPLVTFKPQTPDLTVFV